jgi:flagellar biosynthesis/type III secretory pathway protein FliH
MTGRSFFEENMEIYKSQNENQREEYDMCQALREIREDFFNEGKAEGRAEGREEGHQAGIKEGREEEREAGIRRLIEDNLEEKKTKEIIIQKLIRWFSMDEQTAQLYLDKYAGSENEKEEIYGKI